MGLSTHVPDLAALEVLLGVARSGSLNSAARQIGVSQQAISARIRAMEAQTGVTLVRRTPRGSSLTAEGAAAGPGGSAPDVVLTAVNTETVIGHVSEGAADLGFIEGPRRPTGLRSRIIGHDRLAVVVAPSHPWARRRRGISAAELASTSLVSREGGSGTRDTL